jgi:hypothetical protein
VKLSIIIVLIIVSNSCFAQGYYFSIDKEQFWDRNNVSEKGICDIKLTYLFDWGNNRVIERNDEINDFKVLKVYGYDSDTLINKETWFLITPEQDSIIALIDFTETDNQNINIMYFENDLQHTSKLFQHVIHFRELTKEHVEDFVDNLYK